MRTWWLWIALGLAVVALLGVIGAAISRRFPPPREIHRVAPETSFPPAIEGKPIVGQTLRAGKGLWRHNPTRFAYQWMRCDARGQNCLEIPGATKPSHLLTTADLTHTVLVLVTASNSVGSLTANSHPTDVAVRVPGGGRSALPYPERLLRSDALTAIHMSDAAPDMAGAARSA